MAGKYRPIDLKKVKTYSAKKRETRVTTASFARPLDKNASFAKFLDALPHFLAADALRGSIKAIVLAHKKRRPVIIGLGAHVIKVGLNPLLIDLMKRGIVTGLAMNGAGAIHDFEIATFGRTSEDVAVGLETGMFGMVEETMRDMNSGVKGNGIRDTRGMGERIGDKLVKMKAPYANLSLLFNAVKMNLPATVHVAVGTDTIHMSPHVDAAALGEATFTDFRLLCSMIGDLEGGVYINLGSAVILPEVFLKALTVARNAGHKVKNFTSINMDMIQHYRPRQNVLSRPGGEAYSLTGHHEIMLPLLYQGISESV